MSIKVVGYIRVSTEEQSREGVSLGAQGARLASYASLYDLDLVEVVPDEGVSAKTIQRPGLARVLQALDRREAEGLVVVKLDRLTRSLRDWNDLIDRYFNERRGLKLFSVNEQIDPRTANGRMMLNLLIMVAQWERETVSERTAEALGHKIRTGSRCGSLRFGYDLDPDGPRNKEGRPVGLVANPREQGVIATILRLAGEGKRDRAIAAHLNDGGIPTKTGRGPWIHTAVARIRKRSG